MEAGWSPKPSFAGEWMGLWHVHAQIHRLLQQGYGPYFWTETHVLFPEEDCQGNIGFEGWINKKGIIGKTKGMFILEASVMYLVECSYVFPGVLNARIFGAPWLLK
jgi:hypothetical protein